MARSGSRAVRRPARPRILARGAKRARHERRRDLSLRHRAAGDDGDLGRRRARPAVRQGGGRLGKLGESWECWDENRIVNGPLAGTTIAERAPTPGRRVPRRPRSHAHLPDPYQNHRRARLALGAGASRRRLRAARRRTAERKDRVLVHLLPPTRRRTRARLDARHRRAKNTNAASPTARSARSCAASRSRPAKPTTFRPARCTRSARASVLFETQQASDLTYRIFDWNRLGADGKPRELARLQSGRRARLSCGNRTAIAADRVRLRRACVAPRSSPTGASSSSGSWRRASRLRERRGAPLDRHGVGRAARGLRGRRDRRAGAVSDVADSGSRARVHRARRIRRLRRICLRHAARGPCAPPARMLGVGVAPERVDAFMRLFD